MKVLFDFEVNTRLAHCRNRNLCETIRNFLVYKYRHFETEIYQQLKTGEVAFLLVSFGATEFRLIPYNIPVEIFDTVSSSITQEDFDELQKSLLN